MSDVALRAVNRVLSGGHPLNEGELQLLRVELEILASYRADQPAPTETASPQLQPPQESQGGGDGS